ncbi:MAG: PAS domain S-box protein [Verrucomicrobiales bacterium]|nr:PAS domain S-box protein [Verrucomicrobiales bacterium]
MQNAELQESRTRTELQVDKYTDLYDFAPVGYFSLDEKATILEVNLTGAAMLGLERSGLTRRRLLSYLAPEGRPGFLSFLKSACAGADNPSCEVLFLRKDATPLWALLRGTRGHGPSRTKPWCRVSASDVTSVKLAESALRQNQAMLSAIIRLAPVGVYIVDDRFRLQEMNPLATEIFKSTSQQTDRSFLTVVRSLWPKHVAEEIVNRFQLTLKTGESYLSTAFTEVRRDTGMVESYEWQLQRIRLPAGHFAVVCFFNNITERKRGEAAQQRLAVLAASNEGLRAEVRRRKQSEKALQSSEKQQREMLEQSQELQEQLRYLARKVIRVQEEERRSISRELHDIIAQALTGINIRLATLKASSLSDGKLRKSITDTQHLVEQSVDVIHQFARELRPAVLDDLGLIPALQSFLQSFAERTKLVTRLKTFPGVEKLDAATRTALFRVAQESLTNVARHAQATQVTVTLERVGSRIRMRIADDGQAFKADGWVLATRGKHLGLLGMRERIEMVGGRLSIKATPGKGTVIEATVCQRKPHRSPSKLAAKKRVSGTRTPSR